ncbi:MAG: redox-regulated ATPase YchF [Syntrophorhabdaceae bacterium]|nr:redox-regulated ATPase YchF [Syntrophorhabdaceae bacterium]
MGFSCGIIGLPNSGKSTIFNALTSLSVPCQPYPFCTIEPNVGVVAVPDERLTNLARILKPEKVVPATIEFIDIAGLVKDAHKGEGLGNRFLSHIRNVDAIAHVVRCFKAGDVPHVYKDIDPIRDVEIVETEIIISDLEIIEERLKKIERMAKVSKEKGEEEVELLHHLRDTLEKGSFIDMEGMEEGKRERLRSFNLITTKPLFYIANIDEEGLYNPQTKELESYASGKGKRFISVCGKLEGELSSLPEDERKAYMELYGLKKMAIFDVIKIGYSILGLITFYTIVGKVMRAWTIKDKTPCIKAAAKIHSDMERGFIKAEVINYEDFIKWGNEHIAREKGLVRIEGRDYPVKDGDILHIRFNV